jgi:DNA-binding transcriptional ArsR family regulator
MPIDSLIDTSSTTRIKIQLEPAFCATNSLVLLTRAEELSGLDEWVYKTLLDMSPEERERNTLVLWGLHYAAVPKKSWPSFEAYLTHLENIDPMELRDKLMEAYASYTICEESDSPEYTAPDMVDLEKPLESVDAYLDFLRERFPAESIIEDIEIAAYHYVIDPPALKELIVSHLKYMWETYLRDEWEQCKPMLMASVDAFQQIDYSTMSNAQVAALITGHDFTEDWEKKVAGIESFVFTPTTHAGPYVGQFRMGDSLGIVFGARVPEGATLDAPDLSRAEIVVRLGALADDTRLRILRYIVDNGEKSSKEIMDALDLSQSAASRHLKQLNATGYLTARRVESAKYFSLNSERIENTLKAIAVFLEVSCC